MKDIRYHISSEKLTPSIFLGLVQKIWPGTYQEDRVAQSLASTLNITAWRGDELLGCVRLLTDGYFFSTITEILVDPAHQKQGIGSKLMERVFEASPSSLAFGVQPGNAPFFMKLGYEKGLDSYQKRKDRNATFQ